ncbi:MAG: hypothetical protein M1827_002509 [Pycnora praestabilis]|nr:MAG: hypothetical protein M1827_002509 [Pycnora praestabilis]
MSSTLNGSPWQEDKKSTNGPNAIPSIHLSAERLDAGLRSLDHYKNKLPRWRYNLRQRIIPLVRWETPYLAWMQEKLRSPALDSYFAITANLGTHTFFMVGLPVLFWCGYTNLGRSMVHILAAGVFFSGFIKDLLCLPRPLSPPLQRITMSGSAALEYGFPSTHSTNAISVVVYALFSLHSPESCIHPTLRAVLEVLLYWYAASLILGRLYCGMHGFADVFYGGGLGALLSAVHVAYGDVFDSYMYSGSWTPPLVVAAIVIILVRIHPEPADDCPCFDDGVAFAGVVIGIEYGAWHFAASGLAWDYPVPATTPYRLEDIGLLMTVVRVLFGVLTIFIWRGVMKPTLLRCLPPIFRVVEKLGLSLPRKFFMQASEYKRIPAHHKVDNVIPSVLDLPSLLTSMRHPRRRGVSVGPQSAADAYETLAYREKKRRESVSSVEPTVPYSQTDNPGQDKPGEYFSRPVTDQEVGLGPPSTMTGFQATEELSIPALPKVDSYERLMGTGTVLFTPGTEEIETVSRVTQEGEHRKDEEREEREMFSKLEKPRVRYDVEVVTKLIVYAGIGWIAIEGGPLLFQLCGLGMDQQKR